MAVKVVLLLVWMAGILAPLHWLSRASPSGKAVFDWVFHTHASHVLMHSLLFAVLAFLLTSLCSCWTSRSRRVTVGLVLCAILAIAILQEVIQVKAGRLLPGPNEVFDILVDLNGGALGVLLCIRGIRMKAEGKAC